MLSLLRRLDIPRAAKVTFNRVRNRSWYSSSSEVESATAYCKDLLRKFDAPSHTLQAFIPRASQPAYLAIRAFNVEIARVADTVSSPQIGALRLEFWRTTVRAALAGQPRPQPVAILLAHAANDLAIRSDGRAKLSPAWFLRIIAAREQYLNNAPYTSLAELERYAEHTYSTLLYLTLQALPVGSVAADHVASHIGKAAGIVAVLRGLPLLAFPPPPPSHHVSNAGPPGQRPSQGKRAQAVQGCVPLPLDVMTRAGVREEDVLRRGAEAPGLRDAVFEVATRASDHIITARTMLQNLRRGEDAGHAFEHGDEEEHIYSAPLEMANSSPLSTPPTTTTTTIDTTTRDSAPSVDVERAFGVFMPAVSTGLWLDRLQKLDFDIFRPELRVRDWALPWRAYLAYRRRAF